MPVRFYFSTLPEPAEEWTPQPIVLDVASPPGGVISEGEEEWERWENAQEDRLRDMGYRFLHYLEENASGAFFEGLRAALAEVATPGEGLGTERMIPADVVTLIKQSGPELTKTSMAALEKWAAEAHEQALIEMMEEAGDG